MRISKLNVRNVSLGKTLTAYCTLELMVLPSWTCVVVQINKSVANKLGKVAVRFGRHVEAEAVEAANFRESGSGKRIPLPLWPFISNVKT